MLPASPAASMARILLPVASPVTTVDSDRRDAITAALPLFPDQINGLISEYDRTLALCPLQVDALRVMIKNEENRDIRKAIQEALISNQTDPRIKRQIILNVIQYKYQREFRFLIEELQQQHLAVNFDNTDLSYLKMYGLYFGGASALNLDLSESTLVYVNFSGAQLRNSNLTGTTFVDSIMTKTDLVGAQIDKTNFNYCQADDLVTDDSELHYIAVQLESDLWLKGVHTTQKSHLQLQPITLRSDSFWFREYCSIS